MMSAAQQANQQAAAARRQTALNAATARRVQLQQQRQANLDAQAARRQSAAAAVAARHQANADAIAQRRINLVTAQTARYSALQALRGASNQSAAAADASVAHVADPGQADAYTAAAAAVPPAASGSDSTIGDLGARTSSPAASSGAGLSAWWGNLSTAEKIGLAAGAAAIGGFYYFRGR